MTILAIVITAALVAQQRRISRSLDDASREARAFQDRAEGTARQLVEARDVTRRTEKELEDVKRALDQSTIVAITDSAGTITSVNAQFCAISKYAREELIGQNHRLINSGLHPPEFFTEMWQTISDGRIWHGEIRNLAKDGSLYWVDTTIVPFLDEHGRPYQYVAIRHDITERKRAWAELREQAALAKLGQMAAVVAHELKNPLAGVRGALEIIGRRLPPDSPDVGIIKEMVARLDSLNQMVQDLLVFSRPVSPKVAPIPIGTVLSETRALLDADPELAGVRLEVAGSDPVVQADANLIRAVLLNLLINASQAMGRKGTIRVTVGEQDGLCRVSVADEGPGVPVELREQIFEPFFTTKHRGTGLGLSVARRTVELHGGTIACECPPGGGTVMTFTLPLAG